jgi:RNA polymerase sigma factor (sigma-70 family)
MIEAQPEAGPAAPTVGPADFESFYLTRRVLLFRALVVVTRDVHAAEELTQDAFVNVWERWERVGRMDDPTGYLFRTALNGWLQIHRRAARAARRIAAPHHPADPLETVEDRDLLARRLLELPARQRAALVVTEYLGHDSESAGRVLRIRAGTVRRLASKGKAALRQGHEEEGAT